MMRFNWWIFNTFGGTPAQQNPETGVWEAIPGADAVIGQSLYESLVAGKTMTLMRGSFIETRPRYRDGKIYGSLSDRGFRPAAR